MKAKSSLLEPAHPDGPGKGAVKRLCVLLVITWYYCYTAFHGTEYPMMCGYETTPGQLLREADVMAGNYRPVKPEY